MAKKRVADLLVEVVADAGVQRIYSVSGGSLKWRRGLDPRCEKDAVGSCKTEETAVLAAGAAAHLTGSLVVCARSCGPRNLQLIDGIYDCRRSRVPVVATAAPDTWAEIVNG